MLRKELKIQKKAEESSRINPPMEEWWKRVRNEPSSLILDKWDLVNAIPSNKLPTVAASMKQRLIEDEKFRRVCNKYSVDTFSKIVRVKIYKGARK
jgi:hypothetical protein